MHIEELNDDIAPTPFRTLSYEYLYFLEYGCYPDEDILDEISEYAEI